MLRRELALLRKKNQLKTCNVPVDRKFELGAILQYFENQTPILFNRVKDSEMPLIGGLYGNRALFYEMLGTDQGGRLERILNAIANPIPPKVLSDGPIKEHIVRTNIDIKRMFPVPITHEKDSSSYITSGIMVVKDPETGQNHLAVRRFQVNEGNSISAYVSPASPLLKGRMARWDREGKAVECAVILGYDASFLLTSQIGSAKYGIDKYAVDGGMRGEPLELVRCATVDIQVPAQAEIVLEGVIPPGKRVSEGPFGELMSYYGSVGPHPVIEVQTVMHRDHPIFQHAFPCREEHLANGMIREAELFAMLKNIVDVKDVNVTVGGGHRLHAVISIRKTDQGDGQSAILCALGNSKDLKHVVIVDEDVDIYDGKDVEFALATRVQASKDVVIIPHALGSALEASHLFQGTTDKVGIDATKPLGDGAALFERAKIPKYGNLKDIDQYFK